jgi:hypothetical protein
VVPATSAEGDLIANQFRDFRIRVLDADLAQSEQFSTVQELTAKPEERGKALAAARETLDRLRKDHAELTVDFEEMLKELAKLPDKDRPKPAEIKWVEDRLRLIKSGERKLIDFVAKMVQIEKEENDPVKKEWLAQKERAMQFEKDGEIAKALAIYAKVPEKFNTAELQKHIKQLKDLWEPKGEAHKLARDFVTRTFPKLSTEELATRVKELQSALLECVKVDDAFGVAKLVKELEQHAKRIEKEEKELKPNVNPDDEKPFKRIQELVPELVKIDTDARAFLETKKPAKEGD